MTIETDRRHFMKATALTAVGAWGLAPIFSSEAGSGASSINEGSTSASAERVSPNTVGQDVPLAPPDKQPPDLKIPEIVRRKVGYAIVGLGKLSLEQIMPAFSECKSSEPVAPSADIRKRRRKWRSSTTSIRAIFTITAIMIASARTVGLMSSTLSSP